MTHVIPVVEGYAIGSAIRHIPLAGRDVTHFVQQMLRDRVSGINPADMLDAARRIKESLCYVCPDMAKEFAKFDAEPERHFSSFDWTDPATGKRSLVDVGYERFLGPELFFNPEMASGEMAGTTPLPALVDEVVQACPIDCRRALYENVVLSGGSTMYRDFSKRLQRDLRTLVDARLAYSTTLDPVNKAGVVQVVVKTHKNQRFAVWDGGSLFASMEQFPAFCHTKAEYDECGPSICRQSRVFGSLLA